MTQPDTLHTRLRAELDRRLAVARAATPGPWDTSGPDTIAEWSIYALDRGWMVASAEVNDYPDSPFPKLRGGITGGEANRNAAHIALHDPADAVRRYEGELEVLERHATGYPLGQVEYGWHLERAESGRHVQVRDEEPVAPYYCERCDDFHPCPELTSLAHRLGVSVDG